VSNVHYNHYLLLKIVERIFGLRLLGGARQPQVHAFGGDVVTPPLSSPLPPTG
jgi:hypothetical protein